MDQVISPLHFLRGLGMLGLTVVVQAMTQIALERFLRAVPPPKGLGHRGVVYVVAAVVILVLGLIGEVALWAFLYFSWGELGSFTNSFYFSLACFTTIGASDLALSPLHRIVGTTEAAVGMLMFGWSTALLFEVIQRTRGAGEPASG